MRTKECFVVFFYSHPHGWSVEMLDLDRDSLEKCLRFLCGHIGKIKDVFLVFIWEEETILVSCACVCWKSSSGAAAIVVRLTFPDSLDRKNNQGNKSDVYLYSSRGILIEFSFNGNAVVIVYSRFTCAWRWSDDDDFFFLSSFFFVVVATREDSFVLHVHPIVRRLWKRSRAIVIAKNSKSVYETL